MIRKINCLLVLLAVSGTTSCAYDNPLSISVENPNVTIFYNDIEFNGKKISGPGFIIGPITFGWTGGESLRILSARIFFPAREGKLKGDTTCRLEQVEIEKNFPNIVDMTLRPNQKSTSNVKFACSGVAPTKGSTFTTAGLLKLTGYTGTTDGQKFYKAESKVFLFVFPNLED